MTMENPTGRSPGPWESTGTQSTTGALSRACPPTPCRDGQQGNRRRPAQKRRSPPPASPPSRPLALPAMKGPVELSVELDGRAFALRAPDLEGAAWIHEYAGRLLEDMRRISGNGKDEEPCTY